MTNTHITIGGHKITVNKRDKLWENPSPSSAFAAQTISIPNAGNYDELWWCFKGYSSYSDNVGFTAITQSVFNYACVTWVSSDASNWYIWSRQIGGAGGTYTLTDGLQVGNGTKSTDNNRLIPLYVLGVKY